MKKLALTAVDTWLSYLFVSLQLVGSIVLILGTLEYVHAADFSCPSGDVNCLIASITSANGMLGSHTINLKPGSYTLQAVDNGGFIGNGLPVISSSIRIQATAEDLPTVIERDLNAPAFRIFEVSVGGELTLAGVTIQRGGGFPLFFFSSAAAILNRGVTSLEDSIVRDSNTDFNAAIHNFGTLRVIRSIIADNFGGHQGGGILNSGRGDPTGSAADGNLLVENSTIVGNASADGGGIFNYGSLVVKNSAIIFNSADVVQAGGGIANGGGSVDIVNTTIAKNRSGLNGGGGLSSEIGFNGLPGRVSITNSTIRENVAGFVGNAEGGGISNSGGTLQIQNTIVAGNTATGAAAIGPDCFGTITSLGNNLIGDPTGCNVNLQPSDLTGDPGLGPLVEIGEDDSPGKAFYPVLAGSAVIDRGNPNACLQADQLGLLRVGICDIGAVEFRGPMLVSVDVRPRRDANRINPNSTKNINVAIFSVNGFDATTVNVSTVRFGATGTEAVPINVALRDVNGDGHPDMVVRFEIQDTGIKCGDTSAILTGQIANGPSIIGSSSITTVQCGQQNNSKIAAKLK
jgi:hypothetical protein